MELSDIIIAILIVSLLFCLFSHLLINRSNTITTTTQHTVNSSSQPRRHHDPSQPSLIGGCVGTQFGCCPDNMTSKVDTIGSNCVIPNVNHHAGGCARTQFGCCPNMWTIKNDPNGTNCL